jgi:magnesium-transporting ATPase (P-type)
MEFKYCVIQGKCYEYDRNLKKSKIQKDESSNSKSKKYSIIKIPKEYFSSLIQDSQNKNFLNGNEGSKDENSEIYIINEFWTAISIAHECITSKIGIYSGVSPDDVELVKTAHEQGYTFLQSPNGIREIRIGDSIESFTVLNVLNFSSERKRMSIIIKDKDNVIKLYCKGADSEIMKRISWNSKNNIYTNFTLKCVDKLSCKGYRTLMIAYKIISEDDYDKWNSELKNSEMNLAKKDTLVEKCYDAIEKDLELIGATMVEDKLQDLVPETIKDLRMAGIKIWVLTGDKVDTAENIALGCNLISRNQKIFRIFVNHGDTERAKNNVNPEIEKFFKEYYDFENENNKKNINFLSNKSNNNISNNNSNLVSSNNRIKQQQSSNYYTFKYNNNLNSNNIPNDGSVISFIPSMNASSIVSNKNGNNNISNVS